ncbi:MAG TPA: gamma-glutamylcyclotransferase [Myxococcota bacterium]|nr:gamma-glutamylcyclotransferase [Myxococcota bacterium]
MTPPGRPGDLPLFVYGTLRSGGSQAHLLGPAARAEAWVQGTLWDLPAGYPALQLAGDGKVWGERVAPVGEALLSVLDVYEGVPEGLYQRVIVDLRAGGRVEPAWAWVMADPRVRHGRVLPSGRWRTFRAR